MDIRSFSGVFRVSEIVFEDQPSLHDRLVCIQGNFLLVADDETETLTMFNLNIVRELRGVSREKMKPRTQQITFS